MQLSERHLWRFSLIKHAAIPVLALVILLSACDGGTPATTSSTTSSTSTATTTSVDISKIPGNTLTTTEIQKNIVSAMNLFESGRGCPKPKIANVEITQPQKETNGPWTERWTVDRCGTLVPYVLIFTPDPKAGGAAFSIEPEKKQSAIPEPTPK
jgi:hypothetical protein